MPARQSPRSMRHVGVLITGVGSASTGQQVYKALLLARRDYRITVANLHEEALVVANGATRVLLPAADHPTYVRALAQAAKRGGIRFIVPGSDRELLRVVRDRETLERLSAATLLANNARTIDICSDRKATVQTLTKAGFRTPHTAECPDPRRAVQVAKRSGLRYPIVIKPSHGGGGSANVYLAQDDSELRFFAQYVMRNGVAPILQEYLGTPESEYTIGVLSFPDGTVGGSFALRRDLSSLLSTRLRIPNRTARAELGPVLAVSSGFTQGHADDFPEVRAAAERIAAAVGSTGPLNVQGRMVGSDFLVFEINPRFSGTTSMRAMAGWNEPEALIDWHLGRKPTIGGYRSRPTHFTRALVEYVDSA